MAPSAGVSIGWDRLYGRSLQCCFLPSGDEDPVSSCSRGSRCLPRGWGRKGGDPGGIGDLSDQRYPRCSVISPAQTAEAAPAPGAARAGDPKSGWASISLLLVSLITGKDYSRFPVRTEHLTSKIIKHFTVEVNWCYSCFAAGEN